MTDRAEVLFLALTRPPLVWGVPPEALGLNALLCFISGMELSAPSLWRSPLMFWAASVPIHMILRRLTSWDYHWARTLLFLAFTGRSTLESLPAQRARSAREVPSSV